MNKLVCKINAYQTDPISDHNSIVAEILDVGTQTECMKQIRPIKQESINNFKDRISRVNWDCIINKDVDGCYSAFSDTILDNFELCFPEKYIKINNKNTVQPKWITNGIQISLHNKRAIYELITDLRLQNILSIDLENYYKRYCRILQRVVKSAKKLYYDQLINTSDNKSKSSWKIINSIAKTEHRRSDPLLINNQNGVLINDPIEVANEFNSHYVNITNKLNLSNVAPDVTIKKANQNMFLFPTDENEISNIIKNLKNKKSTGWDNIPTNVIKAISQFITYPLCHIINKSFLTGVFPNELKKTIVKPVFKKNDTTIMDNYRPIAKLSNFSKIYEKLIAKRLNGFLQKFNVICKEQNGFIQGGNIDKLIFEAMGELNGAWNNSESAIALFLDLSKAFDCVDHKRLLTKMEAYGITGTALNLFESYLTNRFQCTEISTKLNGTLLNIHSNWLPVTKGVPQGSVLGPILFVIYTNDFPQCINQKSFMFADDTTVVIRSNMNLDLSTEVDDVLLRIIEWFRLNGLAMNVGKTQAIKLGSYGGMGKEIQTTNFGTIQLSSNITFLGVVVDSKCNWESHIAALNKKISKNMYLIRQLRQNVSTKTVLNAYYSIIESVLRYGIIIWGNSPHIKKLFILQKRVVRTIAEIPPWTSCKPRFVEFKILTLVSIYILECITFYRKYPEYFTVRSEIHAHDTRTKNNLNINISTRSTINSGAHNSIVRIYNGLPVKYKSLSTSSLRNTIRKDLIRIAPYTLEEYFNINW